MTKSKAGRMVRIFPLPGASIPPQDFDPPIRAVEQEVTQEVWTQLKRYAPPAFTEEAAPGPDSFTPSVDGQIVSATPASEE